MLARASYNRYVYDGYYVYPDPDAGSILNRDYSFGEWWGWEGQLQKRMGQRHRLTLGAEYRDNVRQDQRNFDLQPIVMYLDSHRQSDHAAVYVQDAYKVLDDLTIHAGLRYDHSSFGGTANPRLALIYRPLERTTFKFLYGQAFRAPNAYELYYSDANLEKGNPKLSPERIWTYAVTADHYLGDHLRFSGSAYYYAIHDLIVQGRDPIDGLLVFDNSQKVRAKGLEFEMEGKWANGMQTRFSYAVQNAADRLTQASLVDSPRHLGKANLATPLVSRRLFLGIEGQYTSRRLTLRGHHVGGFPLLNLTLSGKDLFKRFDVAASFYNLLDRTYADPGGEERLPNAIVQDGRAFRLKLTYRF